MSDNQKKPPEVVHGLGVILDMAKGHPIDDAFERNGKHAQQAFARGNKLPKRGPDYKDNIPEYRKMGIEVGSAVDDKFVSVKLPQGWKIEPTNHYMWTSLRDDKGGERGLIFYKPEFDEGGILTLSRRFSLSTKRKHLGNARQIMTVHFNDNAGQGFDVGEFTTISGCEYFHSYEDMKYVSREYETQHKDTYNHASQFEKSLNAKAKGIFKKIFPHFEDATAYWDEDVSEKTVQLKKELQALIDHVSREPETIARLVPSV